jgi:hypothetical protein
MQQKARFSKSGTALLALVVIVLGGFVALMMVKVPAPQHAIEKQLDAKAFLEQKQ